MLSKSLALLSCFFGVTNAHFRLLYPGGRGAFVAANEPNFCGGYTEVTTNRTTFPISGGAFEISTSHVDWTIGVLISTVPDPDNFDNFTVNGQQQLARGFAKTTGGGTYCMPLNITAANIPGATDGANVTIQVIFDGGDGPLYQCADLTLSSALSAPPSSVTCSNVTASATATSSGGASATQSTAGALGLAQGVSSLTALLLTLLGLAALL